MSGRQVGILDYAEPEVSEIGVVAPAAVASLVWCMLSQRMEDGIAPGGISGGLVQKSARVQTALWSWGAF